MEIGRKFRFTVLSLVYSLPGRTLPWYFSYVLSVEQQSLRGKTLALQL